MKLRLLCLVPLSILILTASRSNPGSRLGTTLVQDQGVVTNDEREEVQGFAKRFVARILKSRNIAPLIKEFFLSDFTDLSKQDFYEKVSPVLYARLSKQEKVRLFVAQENLGYIITLDVMTQPDSRLGASRPFERILPKAIAQQLNKSRLFEGTAEFLNRQEFLNELTYLERAILVARPFLIRRNIEQSSDFLRKLKSFERDPYLGYRVRGSLIDQDTNLSLASARFPVGKKIFFVETPILLQIVLAKENGKLKILTLVPADGD